MTDEPKRPPRPHLQSQDDFRTIPPGQEKDVFRALKGLEDRLGGKIDTIGTEVAQHREQIQALTASQTESRAEQIETKGLRADVRELLRSDAVQSHDIQELKRQARIAGGDAGRESGGRRGAALSLVVTALTLLFAWFARKLGIPLPP